MDMASGGYYSPYYQPVPYYYNYSQQQLRARGAGGGGVGQSSVHVFLLLAMVSLLAATTLYAWCESAVESMLDQLRLFLILAPLPLILAVQDCVASCGERRVGGGGLMSLLAELVLDPIKPLAVNPPLPPWQDATGPGATMILTSASAVEASTAAELSVALLVAPAPSSNPFSLVTNLFTSIKKLIVEKEAADCRCAEMERLVADEKEA
ncbi:uncharacterized protein LOC133927561 [Phragmites australis]|uniref:uncharacterized protein LOC133927561 n=1 Tax=Phragmites australis TaxID=29695 RepID=UPI002D764A91|nr:uncharacterized protein LOC133927561 [Phragmites australis]